METNGDITLTYGMLQLGMALALVLTGVATVQVWNYMRNFPHDPRGIKIMVVAVYILDTFHSALLLHTSFYYTVSSFGKYGALTTMTWSLMISILVNGIIAFIVQTYYCLRVFRITESRIVALGCWGLCLVRFVLNIVEVVTLLKDGRWSEVETFTFKWQMTATLIIGAASDVFIAGFICAGLLRMRTGFKRTDKLVDKLVAFTIGSGLVTSLAAVTESILYLSLKNFAFVLPYSAVAKLFNNSLLAALNERDVIRKDAPSFSFKITTQPDNKPRMHNAVVEGDIELVLNQDGLTSRDDSSHGVQTDSGAHSYDTKFES